MHLVLPTFRRSSVTFTRQKHTKPMFTTSNAACQGDIFSYLGKIHARNVPYLFLSTGTNPCTSHRGASRHALEARKADFQRKTMLQLIQWFWSQNFSNVLWEAAISGIHMDLCLNLKSLDIFSWCGAEATPNGSLIRIPPPQNAPEFRFCESW